MLTAVDLELESEDARAIPPVFDPVRYPQGTRVRVVPTRGPVRAVLYESTGTGWRSVLVYTWDLVSRPAAGGSGG